MDLKKAFTPLLRGAEITKFEGFNLFGATTKDGHPVNAKTALRLSAFYNALEIIGNDYAKLPKSVYRRDNEARLKDPKHPVSYLISTRPNNRMTAFSFDKMLIQDAIIKGNGYAEIVRNPNTAKIIAFEYIDQDETPVTVKEYEKELFYKFGGKIVNQSEIIHIPGFSFNGITGIGVVQHAAEQMGVSLSSQEAAAEYYKGKGIGTGVLSTDKTMDPDARARYSNAFTSMMANKRSWSVPVIDDGMQFTHLKITPQEALFIETQKNGVIEIARWLNIPPHKLKTLDNVNNSITETQEIQHANDSILPWAIKFEQEYNAKVFTTPEINRGYYVKANINALLRADTKTRAEYYKTAVNFGWMDRNEIRAREDLNPRDGLSEMLVPVNMQTVTQMEKNVNDGE